MRKKMRLILIVAATFAAGAAMAEVIAAWDFNDTRPQNPPGGWTTVSSNEVANGSTIGGITVQLTAGAIEPGAAAINEDANFVADGTPMLSFSTTGNDQAVYEDYFTVRKTDPTFTISGLTNGQQYTIQWIGSFGAAGKQITVKQDGVIKDAMSKDGTSSTNDVVYSTHYTFTAAADDIDVAFTFDGANGGGASNYGVSGLVVSAIPEPETLGLIGMSSFVLLFVRRRFCM